MYLVLVSYIIIVTSSNILKKTPFTYKKKIQALILSLCATRTSVLF